MSTSILSRFPALRHLRPSTLATLAGGERQIVRIAGFFADDVRAHAVLQRLRTEVGLPAGRLAMLRPRDAESRRFERAADGWRALRPLERSLRPQHRGPGAALGAVTGGLLYWAVTLLDIEASAGAAMTALAIGGGWGALVGLLVVMLLERLPQPHRFDARVKGALREGRHAVVVYHVPPHCQAEVLAVMRGHSAGWCAEAPRAAR